MPSAMWVLSVRTSWRSSMVGACTRHSVLNAERRCPDGEHQRIQFHQTTHARATPMTSRAPLMWVDRRADRCVQERGCVTASDFVPRGVVSDTSNHALYRSQSTPWWDGHTKAATVRKTVLRESRIRFGQLGVRTRPQTSEHPVLGRPPLNGCDRSGDMAPRAHWMGPPIRRSGRTGRCRIRTALPRCHPSSSVTPPIR
jgi:hypothetical protein